MAKKDQRGQKIEVGDISGSTGVAIGSHIKIGAARATPGQPVDQLVAVRALQEFIDLLSINVDAVPHVEDVQEAAIAVKDQLAAQQPNRRKIRELFMEIVTSVGGVAQFADSIDKIRIAIAHLISS